MHRFRVVVLLALTLALTATLGAWPQLGLPRLPKRLPREVPRLDRLPSLDDLLNRQPLTSTLDDAVTGLAFHAPVALPAGPATVDAAARRRTSSRRSSGAPFATEVFLNDAQPASIDSSNH